MDNILKKDLLVLSSIWPQAHASAASSRVLSLVKTFLNDGYQITFSADERENQATEYLRQLGVSCLRLAPNDSAFDEILKTINPNVCIFDRFGTEEKFGWRVQQNCPDALRILDTIDLHFIRLGRQRGNISCEASMLDYMTAIKNSGDVASREVAAIFRSDLVLMVSDYEIDLLSKHCLVPKSKMLLSRLTYPHTELNPSFSERSGFAMIGNFLHPPNEDAVYWVREEIWPKIRQQLPDATLNVWGSHASAKHLALNNPKQGFYIKGYASDEFAALKHCRVNLAPLRFGAGIKGKIADGWFTGTPVVTTKIGIEGMTSGMDPGGIVAGSADDIAEKSIALYNDEIKWNAASKAGERLINELYSTAATMEPIIERLSRDLQNLSQLRSKDFIGTMLWQQGLRSTEYFSRWIEEKNSNRPKPAPTA